MLQGGAGTHEGIDPGSRGRGSSSDTAIHLDRRRSFEDLDAAEEALVAMGAGPPPGGREIGKVWVGLSVLGVMHRGWGHVAESGPAAREPASARSVGEETVVADADEALGEDVEEEAAHELGQREGERSDAPAAVVHVAEADRLVIDVQESRVGDGNAVGVAGEVLEDVVGVLEWRFGIDDPLGLSGTLEVGVEGCRACEWGEVTVELERSLLEGMLQLGQELAPEESAEHTDGKEEARSTGLPGVPVVGEAPCGDDAVHVGMVDEGLAPGVEDGEEAEAGAEVTGIGGDLLERAGGTAQEEIIEDGRILESQRREALRQGEDDMRVGHRQHVDLARFEPRCLSAALTLRAVTVATRVVRDRPVPTSIALVDMASEPRGPARE